MAGEDVDGAEWGLATEPTSRKECAAIIARRNNNAAIFVCRNGAPQNTFAHRCWSGAKRDFGNLVLRMLRYGYPTERGY